MSSYPSLAGTEGAHNVGKDEVRSKATTGIHLHHTCLRIKDPKVSLPFYKQILGMKTLFTYNAGSFSIFYMYHSDKDGDTEEVWESFPTQKGLLELIHRHGSENEDFQYCSGNEVEHQGFGHLGLMVEDVPATVARAEAAGYKVIKRQGEASAETVGWPAGTPEPIKPYLELYSQMAMIQGPDNYWFELVPAKIEQH
ncbi:lactoylglutathione lyase [Sporobolomyces koalae]|uniref:lactoylglutathione lyase n=1 Tax=Sporobolomyces koalae TaxID=500713 RepID=UPI00317D7F10